MEHRDVHEFARASCLADGPVGLVGIETEWFVFDPDQPELPVPPARTLAALGLTATMAAPAAPPPPAAPAPPAALAAPTMPAGSRVTFEPGGQLELSAPPLPLPGALRATAEDLAEAQHRLRSDGLALAGLGADPLRPPCRQLTGGRYAAMEEYFAAGRHVTGKTMMCSTAALQVNLDAGPAEGWARRWWLAHAIGPTLVAMFAASPVLRGSPAGMVSSRQDVWSRLDRSRTAPVPPPGSVDGDPGEQWGRYLLDARLMLVRTSDSGGHRAVRDGSTFADWIGGHRPTAGSAAPTLDDLSYHATTVFPPVRPRGWLELRYLDAQPPRTWPLAVVVATALLDDPVASEVASAVCAPVAGRWAPAAILGLADPSLHRAAVACARAALDAAPRLGVEEPVLTALRDFTENDVARGRSPAHGMLDAWRVGGPRQVLAEAASWEDVTCVPAA